MTNSVTTPIESKAGCLASCMAVLGNKWTALIVRDLAEGTQRFSTLEKSIADINPRTLSRRLDELEEHGIIEKRTSPETSRIEYTLTPKGEDLVPVLRQMAEWGTKYYQA